MKNININAVLDALKPIKLGDIKDNEVKNALLKIHLTLLKAQRVYGEKVKDLETAYFSAFEKERGEFTRIYAEFLQAAPENRKELGEAVSKYTAEHKDYTKAMEEHAKAVSDLNNEDVEIADPLDATALATALQEQNITLGVLEILYQICK